MEAVANMQTSKAEERLIQLFGIVNREIPSRELDISESIKELAYLTHSYYRYYGKFPSKLASIFLDQYSSKDTVLLDNYVGSGTSLVEASLRGIKSYGLDINPLAIVASNVKTYRYSKASLSRQWAKLIEEIHSADSENSYIIPKWSPLEKWFSEDVIKDLSKIKSVIMNFDFEDRESKEFFKLAFYSIIRRVSRAYDGEVRPHINKSKRQRDVAKAFIKKVSEMIALAGAFEYANKQNPKSKSFLGSNSKLNEINEIKSSGVNLVLSHPPYLNCFDYLPVFSLELAWAEDDNEIFGDYTLKDLKALETKSWPATEKISESYFNGIKTAYEQVYELLPKGGICGIVIGDSTIKGELIRVHRIVAAICEDIGFTLEEILYRTTHYGTGKYAYSHRADYHGENEDKKDGILVLRK